MLRGPYKGKQEQYKEAIQLRKLGHGFRSIAHHTGVHWRTIKGWIGHIPVDPEVAKRHGQKLCRKELSQLKHKAAIKRRLIEERGHQCEGCRRTKWSGEAIPLEIHHCDGDKHNQAVKNLRLLCPNCHAFTPTYRGKNVGRRAGTG